ncbi:MAG: PorT family protein [Bacteroidales bacterium]|nr:PorT family protein [Bacteroidales bacterium]
MKKTILYTMIACLMLVSSGYTSFAQDVKVGLRGGVNFPTITSGGTKSPASDGYSSRTAFGTGIFTEIQFKKSFSLRWGVEYSGQGGKKNGMQAFPTSRMMTEMISGMGMGADENVIGMLMGLPLPQYYYADVKNTVKFDYVMIPILAQYTLHLGNSPWSVYINAGPYVSFLVNGEQASKGTSSLYADANGQTLMWNLLDAQTQQQISTALPDFANTLQNSVPFGDTNITGEMKSTNFGVTGNIGIKYECGRNSFFVEGGGNYGFLTIQQNSQNGTNRLCAISVMAGYAFSMF